jgi:putative restriction endonuclease
MPGIEHKEQAIRIWTKLIEAAKEGKDITYTELGKAVTIAPDELGPPLYVIQDYCRDNGLPPLTIVVVYKATGQPGDGIKKTVRQEYFQQSRQQVFHFDWAKHTQRFIAQMEKN